MVMTASTLYEAVEPHTVWKQLLNYVILEILGDTLQVEVRNRENEVRFALTIYFLGNPYGQIRA